MDDLTVYQKPKTKRVYFLCDFSNLSLQLKCEPHLMSKIDDMLLESEVFKYAMSLDLNTGYNYIRLNTNQLTYMYQYSPMGKIR